MTYTKIYKNPTNHGRQFILVDVGSCRVSIISPSKAFEVLPGPEAKRGLAAGEVLRRGSRTIGGRERLCSARGRYPVSHFF